MRTRIIHNRVELRADTMQFYRWERNGQPIRQNGKMIASRVPIGQCRRVTILDHEMKRYEFVG